MLSLLVIYHHPRNNASAVQDIAKIKHAGNSLIFDTST